MTIERRSNGLHSKSPEEKPKNVRAKIKVGIPTLAARPEFEVL
jgi:hypothetical protein